MKSGISKKVALFISCVFCIMNVAWATDQHITVNTTWSGTVNQSTNIIIDNGVTLTVLPGTQVNFSPNVGIVVNGRLLAVGTANDSIRFTASNTTSGWDGITMNGTPSANDTTKIVYCVLSYGRNSGTSYHGNNGGVFQISGVSKFLITNSRLHQNVANQWGGAINLNNAGGAIRNNIIAQNSGFVGGGMFMTSSGTLVTGNLFQENYATSDGGAISFLSCSPHVTNCTFFLNHSQEEGGALDIGFGCGVNFTNCIFYGDYSGWGNEIAIDPNSGLSNFYYCVVQGGIAGIGGAGASYGLGEYQNNLDTDPMFTGTGSHPFSLRPNSPCVNQGKPDMSALDVPVTDLAGNPRIDNTCLNRIDMGAYEYKRISSFSTSGTIAYNTSWCADTVFATGNITINNGVTLNIGSGTLVYFMGYYGVTVNGTVLAEGESTGNIVFRPQSTSQGWSGIYFHNLNVANDTSRFAHCQFWYGKAGSHNGAFNGGAVYISNFSKFRIEECSFQHNSAANEGGAIFLDGVNTKISECYFSDNQSTRGGAISVNNSTLTLTHDTLSGNVATDCLANSGGGGLFCNASTLNASSNLFSGNDASWGGGISLVGVIGTIEYNTITGNSANLSGCGVWGGGGICFAASSNPVFRYNRVTNNVCEYAAGMVISHSNPQLIQNLVTGNQSVNAPGGIEFDNASPLLLNNTICDNYSEFNTAGLELYSSSSPVIRNTILYGNANSYGNTDPIYLNDGTCNPDLYYCNFQNGRGGITGDTWDYNGDFLNNINALPGFINSGNNPYQIISSSSCLNMGDPSTTTTQAGAEDLAGNPRRQNGRIDIGAYETEREIQVYPGSAIQFTESIDSVVLDNPSRFSFINTFTFECWLKTDTLSPGYYTILKKGSDYELRLFYDPLISVIEFGINSNSVFSYFQTPGSLLVNHWNHIAAVFDLSAPVPYLAIYVNGVEGYTQPAETITYSSDPVTIGAGFPGLMDELRIWQTARTLEDLRTNMHLMIPPETSGLMTYHQFNNYNGNSIVDLIEGNNGTPVNMNLPGCLVGSTVPAAGGASHHKIISSTGKADFTGTGLSMDIKSLVSTDTVVVSRLDTLPNLNPPGSNYVQPQYWITDVFGSGNLTADLTFHVLQNITIDDEAFLDLNRLYSRGRNSDSLWAFVKNSSSASTTGNTVTFNDISHSGQFCVPHRAVPDDIAGKALQFNGVNQYVKIDPLYMTSPDAITIETWIYPTALTSGNSMILYNGDHGEFDLIMHQGAFCFSVKLNDQNWYFVNGTAPVLNMWQHVCGVWLKSGSLKIYVNGVLRQSASIPSLGLYDPGSEWMPSIGCYNRSNGFIAGKLDELRVWDVERTTQQIREYMHLTIPDETAGMLGYWQFNENSGNVTKDHGGNHDGLLVNMSDTCRIWSSIPAGGGNSYTKVVNATGPEEFSGTGVWMDIMEKSGVDTLVVTHIDTSANINPVVDSLYAAEYWVIHQYGNGTLNAKIRFDVGGDVTRWDESHPAGIALLSRPCNSADKWEYSRHADSAWRSDDRIQFSGIASLSQFAIGKGIRPIIQVSPDSVQFVRSPSTVTIADSVLISNQGTDTLKITGITHSNSQFTISHTEMTLQQGEQRYLVVYYHPAQEGNAYDTLHIVSNDKNSQVTNVRIKGEGFIIDYWPGTTLEYDGSNKYVFAYDNNSLDLTNNYTLEAWINIQEYEWLGGIISKYQTPGANGYTLRLTGEQPYSGLNFDGVTTATGILALNQWYHVAAVNDNGTRRIYLDGISIPLTGTPHTTQANNDLLTIGRDYNSFARFFKGKIDEVRIWNVVRTEQQIRENMHLTLKGNEPGLVSYYQFNEGTGTSGDYTAEKIHNNRGTLVDFAESDWVPSTLSAGGGVSSTQTVSVQGQTDFPGTGVSMNFTQKAGTDQVVVSRIDTSANINPGGSIQTFNKQYWAIHQYGSGTFVSDITFTLQEDLGQRDQDNPSRIILDSRGCLADTNWGFRATSANADAGEDQVTFSGISGFGQFVTGRGRIIYVKSNATGNNDGSSWSNAFTGLQSSLDEAVAGNQVWVTGGTYLPVSTYGIPLPTSRHKHFRMKNNLGIFGGFAGIEADTCDLAERDLVTNETILSGDLNDNGTDNNDCYHLFFHPSGLGLLNTAILDGFTIRGANANGADPYARGGGMYNISNSPGVRNCIFKENYALNGGGLSNSGSCAPQFYNCLFVNNSATPGGGGVYTSSGSNPAFTNCTFAGNTALTGGGIVHSGLSNTVLNNCIIWGNTATAGTNPGNLELYLLFRYYGRYLSHKRRDTECCRQ
jgi:hypothetical protein